MTDVVGNPEEERRAAFYHEPWSQEAVSRYFYCKVMKLHLAVSCALSKTSASGCSCDTFMFFFPLFLSLTDPAEETGAGTGLSCPQHLNQGPPESLQLISELCVCVRVSMCVFGCVCEAIAVVC